MSGSIQTGTDIGAEEITQAAKWLLREHEDLSLYLQHPQKNLTWYHTSVTVELWACAGEG